MAPFLVAVHAGAGYHSPDREEEYKRAMRRACKAGAAALEAEGGTPLAAVAAALAALEDDPCTNAGTGSNLNIEGWVECDAAAMAGDGAFGAVAAAAGVRNPGAAAARLAADSRRPLSHGRVRPMVLAGDGAREWALAHGLEAAPTAAAARTMHVTQRARRQHQRYLDILNGSGGDGDARKAGGEPAAKRARRSNGGAGSAVAAAGGCGAPDPPLDDLPSLYDTVGAVVVDSRGTVAAGVSSGGIALKFPGRVGEAAAYGAGCWAAATAEGRPAVAASVTGVGERIMRRLVAKGCADAVEMGPDVGAACAAVLERAAGDDGGPCPTPRDCGVLCAAAAGEGGALAVHLAAVLCAARSMAVGWLAQDDQGGRRAGVEVLRAPAAAEGGAPPRAHSLEVGVHWELPPPGAYNCLTFAA